MSSRSVSLRRLSRPLALLLTFGLACETRVEPQAAATPPPAALAPVIATPAPSTTPAPSKPPVSPYAHAADMDYIELIHVPPGTPAARRPDPDAALPMLIAIHGRGDRPEEFQDLIIDLPVTVRVIVPRGLDVLDGGFSWFPLRARSPDVAGLSQGMSAAGDRVAALIAHLQKTRPTVGLPVVTGFSQGGMLSFELAVHHPELLSVAIPVSGYLPPPLWPTAPPTGRNIPKLVVLHGEADDVVKFPPTLEAVQHLEKIGWPVTLKRYPEVEHAIPPNVRRELYLQLQRALEPRA